MKFGTLFDTARRLDIAITIADPETPDCPVIFVNPAFTDLTGYTLPEAEGRNCRFLQDEPPKDSVRQSMRMTIEGRLPGRFCISNARKDGEQFHNLLFMRPIQSEDGCEVIVGCQYRFELGDSLRSIAEHQIKVERDVQTLDAAQVARARDAAARAAMLHRELETLKVMRALGTQVQACLAIRAAGGR